MTDKQMQSIKDEAKKEVVDAVVFARASAMPEVEELYKDILA